MHVTWGFVREVCVLVLVDFGGWLVVFLLGWCWLVVLVLVASYEMTNLCSVERWGFL